MKPLSLLTMIMTSMIFCIFSYNRGRHLRNCVDSIEQCIDEPDIRVFDDNSDDQETLQVLATIAKKHQVLLPSSDANQSKHGGLYGNMQQALDTLPDEAYACFLQDDMQLVRPMPKVELEAIAQHFEDMKSVVFLHPCFLKLCNYKKNTKQISLTEHQSYYVKNSIGHSAGGYYSDIFITYVKRLRESGWKFEAREKSNEAQARGLFQPMHFMLNPFIVWLPNVSCYRGKNKTLILKWAEKSCNAGFYPAKIMDDEEQKNFLYRDKKTLPFAENYISISEGDVKVPWIYYPLQGRQFLKKLNALELYLRK